MIHGDRCYFSNKSNVLESVARLSFMTPNVEQIIRSIQQLPEPEREKVRQWLEDERTSDGTGKDGQAKAGRSEKSLRWLNDNRQKYLGQWVALDCDRLIAS